MLIGPLRGTTIIDAFVLLVPIVSLWTSVARSSRVGWDIRRNLKHDGSHHFVVLVVKDMAMVDITWELAKLVTGNVEEVACLSVLLSEIRFGPSETVLKSLELINKCSIFPSGVVRIL
jgi:hypothetical protein